jgi:hypothetical protein
MIRRHSKRYGNRVDSGTPRICPLCQEPFHAWTPNQRYCGRKHCRERDARVRAESPTATGVKLGRAIEQNKLALEGEMASTSKVTKRNPNAAEKLQKLIDKMPSVPSTDQVAAFAVHNAARLTQQALDGVALSAADERRERRIIDNTRGYGRAIDQMQRQQALLGEAMQIKGSELPGVQPVAPQLPVKPKKQAQATPKKKSAKRKKR